MLFAVSADLFIAAILPQFAVAINHIVVPNIPAHGRNREAPIFMGIIKRVFRLIGGQIFWGERMVNNEKMRGHEKKLFISSFCKNGIGRCGSENKPACQNQQIVDKLFALDAI